MVVDDPNAVIETRLCSDCDTAFDFTAGEKRFYSDRGLLFRPNRCRLCREIKKLRDRDVEPHIAVCVECGERCVLPFRPREDKAVLCRDCFNKSTGMAPNGTETHP